jgi:hypothetical protein
MRVIIDSRNPVSAGLLMALAMFEDLNHVPADAPDDSFRIEANLGKFWKRLGFEWIDVPHPFLECDRVTIGQLLAVLETSTINDRTLTFAGRFIVEAFWRRSLGRFHKDERGVRLVEKFVDHSERQASSLEHFLGVYEVCRTMDRRKRWKSRQALGWTRDVRESLVRRCRAILNRREWPALVTAGLASFNDGEYDDAETVAEVLNIDTWNIRCERLRADPFDPERWDRIVYGVRKEHVPEAVTLADEMLAFADAMDQCGPQLGTAAKRLRTCCLPSMMQLAAFFPGTGARLVTMALESMDYLIRVAALNALRKWDREFWPDGTIDRLRQVRSVVAARRPDDFMVKLIDNLLAGRPSET